MFGACHVLLLLFAAFSEIQFTRRLFLTCLSVKSARGTPLHLRRFSDLSIFNTSGVHHFRVGFV